MSMHLVVRADATSSTGAGHVARGLVLAEAWVSAGLGTAQICGEVNLPFIAARIQELHIRHCGPYDHGDPAAQVIIVDSYDPSVRKSLANYEGALKVVVDDIGGWIPPDADVVWNPNAYGTAALYPSFVGELLTGPDFIAVRRDLPVWDAENCRGVAVALGASQVPGTLSNAIAIALADYEVVRTGSVVAPGWSTADAVRPWQALAGCCLAVIGGGTTAWEAAAVGIPAVVVAFVDNQSLVAKWAIDAGVPTVHVSGHPSVEELATELRLAIPFARSMPVISDGSWRVAHRLAALAGS